MINSSIVIFLVVYWAILLLRLIVATIGVVISALVLTRRRYLLLRGQRLAAAAFTRHSYQSRSRSLCQRCRRNSRFAGHCYSCGYDTTNTNDKDHAHHD